jgi:hypothetical protein
MCRNQDALLQFDPTGRILAWNHHSPYGVAFGQPERNRETAMGDVHFQDIR